MRADRERLRGDERDTAATGQPGDAYHVTYYASGNAVYQLMKRLTIGGEVLYGYKGVKSGNTGDDVRFQIGVVYSIFD